MVNLAQTITMIRPNRSYKKSFLGKYVRAKKTSQLFATN